MASYMIYKWHKAGIDAPAGEIESWCATAALESFAERNGLGDYSIDSTRWQDRTRVWLCPPFGRPAFFYAYTDG